MKNMKFLLQLIAVNFLSVSSLTTAIACSTKTSTTANISSGVVIKNISIAANINQTYADLNSDSILIGTISAAINSAKGVAVTVNHDYIISNDQVNSANQAVGATVKFTVIGVSEKIIGSFDFLVTLSKTDISQGVTISDPATSVNFNQTYGNLNNDVEIISLVVNAIKQAKNLTVNAGSDFFITNNQTSSAKQTIGTPITFTVTGTGRKITGSFTFIDTLGKVNISNGVTITDLQTDANIGANYTTLNTNTSILNAVITAINTAKKTNINSSNITLTNDQIGNQIIGQPVTFTVSGNGNQVTGSFQFIDTLAMPDISSGVTIADLQSTANPTMPYIALNTYNNITSKVALAINTAKGTSITASDFTLTNNQMGNQVIGTPVTFTVTANHTNQIAGSFTFIDTLGKVNISNGVALSDPRSALNSNNAFSVLNTDPTLLTAVVNAINTAKGTNITSSDITLNNNRSGNQTANASITFIVTANPNSKQIIGSFQFTDTLGKADISSGVVINNLGSTVNPSASFSSLNSNSTITNAVITAINGAKGISITNNDVTITNNQIGAQVPNTVVTFTVTANPNSPQIQGSFKFIDTLGNVNITGSITTYDPGIGYDPAANYAALNTNPYILNLVSYWIQTAKNITVTAGTDFTLTNNQPITALQVAGTAVGFTVTATSNGKLNGSFQFIDTLAKMVISSNVNLPDFRVPASSSATYGGLNSASVILTPLINAINTAKMTNAINVTDFTLTNNQTSTAATTTGTVVVFNVTATNTGKLSGSFQFSVTLT